MIKYFKSCLSNAYTKTFLAVGTVMCAASAKAADLVAVDATGHVTFDPSGVVTPIQTCIVATVLACTGIVILVLGVRWLYRIVKGTK